MNGASVNRLPPPASVSSACGVAPMLNTLPVPVSTTTLMSSRPAMWPNAPSRPAIISGVNMFLLASSRMVTRAMPSDRTRSSTASVLWNGRGVG